MKLETNVETAILGVLLMYPDEIEHWIGIIDADDIQTPLNRKLWELLVNQYENGRPADIVIVNEIMGGHLLPYLTKAVEDAWSRHMPEYVRILKQSSFQHKITEIVRQGIQDKTQPEEWAAEIAALPQYSEKPEFSMVELAAKVKDIASHKQGTAYRFNLPSIQRLTGGLDPAELLIIGGNTAMGKTSLAIHFSIGFAQDGNRVLFCTAEMSEVDIARRQLANMCRIDTNRFRAGTYDAKDDEKVNEAVEQIKEWEYNIKRVNTVAEIRAAIAKYKPEIVIIDHLQNLSGKGKRFEIVSDNIGQLQNICLLEDVAMIVLSQFHRPPDKKKISRPKLSDFRSTGEIEEKSTMALLCYWPARAEDKVMRIPNEPEEYEINIAKNRSGRTGYCKLDFYPEWSKFCNYTGEEKHTPQGIRNEKYEE